MQPVSAFQYARVSGTEAGTTVVKADYGRLERIVIGANKEGTVALYDNASGTSTASLLTTINNNSGSIPVDIDFDLRFKNGLVAEVGGTTDLLIIYE